MPLLAGCGGGGGAGSALPALRPAGVVTPGPAASAPAAVGSASATVTIVVSPSLTTTSGVSRTLRYVSPSTKSATVVVTPQLGNPITTTANCSGQCNISLNAPVGPDVFAVTLYDAANGTGNVLSSGTTTIQVLAGQSNPVALSFGGNPSSVALSYDPTKLVAGTASTIPLAVTVRDASGSIIVGSDTLSKTVTLSDSDTTGVTKLSATTMTTPSTPVSLVYSGGAVASAKITAAVASSTSSIVVNAAPSSASASLAVAVPTPTPAAGIPAHAHVFAYYGANYVNTAIPASYIVANTDFVEMSESQTSIVNTYAAAGGTGAIVYTDPTFQPYCIPPFTQPAGACSGPIAQLITSETAWYHDASGNRIYRQQGTSGQYQEALNLGSTAAQSAYRQFTQNLVNLAPQTTYFLADDSGSSYSNGNGNPLSGFLYGYSGTPVELASESAYQSQEQAMLASATRPVWINGGDVSTWKPAYNGLFLTSPNVAGQMHEGCLNDWNGLRTDTYGYFQNDQNSLLLNTTLQRYALCLMSGTGTVTPAQRLYQVASWWLSYDPNWSVAGPISKASDGYAIFAEYGILPRQPLQTATSDIAVLRNGTAGAYVREFSQCYQGGTAIGPCAAIVNSSAASVSIPPLTQTYAHSLVLDDKSSYGGGTAQWTGSVPTTLAAATAVVLH